MSIDEALAAARARLDRATPGRAAAAHARGALLVDIRPSHQRASDGEIPGALVIDRNVLEWRLDPGGTHCLPELRDRHQTVILVCDEGYASSLAAAGLQALGLRGATDLDGGFRAWRAAGLPVTRA